MTERLVENENHDLIQAVDTLFRGISFEDIPDPDGEDDGYILHARLREKRAYDTKNWRSVLLMDGLFLLDEEQPNFRVALLVVNEGTKDETVVELDMDSGEIDSYYGEKSEKFSGDGRSLLIEAVESLRVNDGET